MSERDVGTGPVIFATLADADSAIMEFVSAYHEAGQALIDIREHELWREGDYQNFEDYVERRWSWTSGRASQLEAAGRFVRFMGVNSPALAPPENERQFRPLLQIKRRKRQEPPWDFIEDDEVAMGRRVACWQIVRDQSVNQGEQITAKFVESVVMQFYKGGVKVPRTRVLTLKDLEVAFEQIVESGVTPAEAVAKFGDPDGWDKFTAAAEWMAGAVNLRDKAREGFVLKGAG